MYAAPSLECKLVTHLTPLQCTVYITFDDELKDPVTKEPAKARNSDIIEDLGQASS